MAVIERSTRARPRFRIAAIGAFVLLLPIALYALWDYVEARRLAHLVAEISARHEPVELRETMAVSMSEQRNAARFYDAAAALVGNTDSFAAIVTEIDRHTASGLPAPSYARLRSWLESNADAESMLGRATALDFLGYPAGTDYNFRWDRLSWLANLATARGRERAAAGDGDGTLKAVVELVKLCRPFGALDTGRTLPGSWAYALVPPAAAAVQSAIELHPSDATLRAAQQAFAERDDDSALETAILRTRARALGLLWDAGAGWYARTPRDLFPPVAGVVAQWSLVRPLVAHRAVRYARELTVWLDIARRPWPDRLHVPRTREPGKLPTNPWSYQMLEHIARVNFSLLGELFRRMPAALASTRTAETALAIERYRLAHAGHPPGSLPELVPEFLPAVPIDPYTGRPILYKATGSRWVVYSVGPDEKDDGGTQIAWPRRPGSMFLAPAPPRDIGIEGMLTLQTQERDQR